MPRKLFVWLLLSASSIAGAQLAPIDPDWKESEVPPPPALRTEGLIPLEMQRSDLQWGVDPESIQVGEDGIVRYVVVAQSRSGAVNAAYEGVRCSTGEVKVYARHTPSSGWAPAGQADWQALYGNTWRHSLAIARGGVCDGAAANGPVSRIVQDLQSRHGWRSMR